MPSPLPDPVRPTPFPRWLTVLGALLLVLAVYLPSALAARFLNFDDQLLFDPQVGALRDAGDGFWAAIDPRRTIANVYLPVSHLSLWFDRWLFGLSPFGPHLMSLLFHALAGVALVRWLLAMALPVGLAHAAGALFLLHPALCESAAWVSSRKDELSGLFVFLALASTARYAFRPTPLRLCGIALLGVLALYSKATAVVLPLLALAVCLYLRDADRRRFRAPLLLLLVTLPIALHHQAIAAAEGTMAVTTTLAERLPQAPGALLHYLRQTFWPGGLNVLYPEVQTLERFRQALWPGLAAALLLLLGALWFWRSGRRAAGLGLLLLLLALLPFNTVFPASAIAAADRYLYLAIPGAALAVLAMLAPLHRRAAAVAGAALALPLAILCFARAGDFRDSETLWQASLAVDADNAVAQLNLANALEVAHPGDCALLQPVFERALAAARYPIHELHAARALCQLALFQCHYQEAGLRAKAAIAAAERVLQREVDPQRRQQAAQVLLATLVQSFSPLQLAGETEAAQQCVARAGVLAPEAPMLVGFRGLLACAELEQRLQASGQRHLAEDDAALLAAIAPVQQALAAAERDPDLCYVMGRLQLLADHQLEALKYFRRTTDADPGRTEAWLAAAQICRLNEQPKAAESYARKGMLLSRPEPQLRFELALALAAQARLDDAIDELELYVRMRPKDRDAARILSSFLCGKAIAGMGDKSHADLERLLQRALQHNPQEPRVDIVRGKICRDRRQWTAAIEHFERAQASGLEFDELGSLLAQSYRDRGYELLLEQKDEDGAVAAWRQCLRLAPPELDTGAMQMQLRAFWQRSEQLGVDRLKQRDRAGAEAAFRRCLAIDPDQHWAAWLLATALYGDPQADLAELDRLTAQALAWQQQHGLDRSKQVWLRAQVLQKLERDDEAQKLRAEYLATPDADADPQVLALLKGEN